MAVINWAFLCDYAFVDPAGKASIIGKFDFISFSQLPKRWPQMFVAIELQLQPDEMITIGTAITTPSGKTLARLDTKTISGRGRKFIMPIGFYNVLFHEAGEHHIEIYVKDISVHHIPFNVVLRSKEQSHQKTE